MPNPHDTPDAVKRLRRARFVDRSVTRLITVGGLAVLASVVLMVAFIGYETLPLLRAGTATPKGSSATVPGVLALAPDDYREVLGVVSADGKARVVETASGAVRREVDLGSPLTAATLVRDPPVFLAVDSTGNLRSASLDQRITFDDAGGRHVDADLRVHEALPVREDGGGLDRISGSLVDEEKVVAVVSGPGFLGVARFKVDASRVRVSELPGMDVAPDTIRSLAVASFGDSWRVYAGLQDGRLFRWDLGWTDDPVLHQSVKVADVPVTCVGILLGQETFVTGTESGGIAAWFGVRPNPEANHWDLQKIREFEPMPSAVTTLVASRRNRAFVAADRSGEVRVVHGTTGKALESIPSLDAAPVAAVVAPKADGFYVADVEGRLHAYDLSLPHPETTLRTLFLPVWYEGAEGPALKWQSTGGDDAFEPKLSLSVLVFGSLKGVFYASLIGIPIALLAAIYTGLFLPGWLRGIVKPVIEIMAAIPSVVVGLIAALWLSPLLEKNLSGAFVSLPAFFLTFALLLAGWALVPRRRRAKLVDGLGIIGVVAGGIVAWLLLTAAVGPLVEQSVFGGADAQAWMREQFDVRYDPRNALVVGLAMGFAVIPVIYTIAEDAINNVPRSLWAASEALGASRWQTTWRVVLPAATPGIFAALMLGFGRAVGETMIVLMATGNTPLLDPSPFNGMRTISACIAVEIPEAPHGGTLYRVLFLSGVLLFLFTFLCNTVAELVGERLRRRYGRL